MDVVAEELEPCKAEGTLDSHEFKAAGVLPFAFNGGEAWVLLGGEYCRTGPEGKFTRLMCELIPPIPAC